MLVAAISFTAMFGGLRGLTWLIHNHIGPFHNIEMGGRSGFVPSGGRIATVSGTALPNIG